MKAVLLTLALLLSSCYGTYYLSDAEYSDAREEHASITYYQGNIYWGWSNGYYYYYGTPHYYPWNYYYNTCPPSHYSATTHIVINKPVNKPTHRPNWNKPTNKPNRNIKVDKCCDTKKTVKNNRSNVKIKTNRSNTNRKSINRRKSKWKSY